MNTVWTVVAIAVIVYMVYRMLPARGVKSLTADGLNQLLKEKNKNVELIDVRESSEFQSGHIAGFKNIPLSQFRQRINELSEDKRVVLMCRSGARSMQAARILKKNGFHNVSNVAGGITHWNGSVQK